MSAKQDRQGVRTATDLEQKYNFDKTFAELMGIATDARNKVDSATSTLRNEMKEQYTAISRDTEKIILEALEKYVKTGDYEEYKRTVESELKIMADRISATVSSTEEKINEVKTNLQTTQDFLSEVDGDLQSAKETLSGVGEDLQATKDSLSQQVTILEEYRRETDSEFVVMSDQIAANLQSTEEKITEVRTDLESLDGEVNQQAITFEEYKQTTSSDLTVMNDQISMGLASTTEQISGVRSDLQSVSEDLVAQISDVESFKEQTESELLLLNDRLALNFEVSTEQISSVNGELQQVREELEKHFEFRTDGLIIKAGENSMQLLLDNDVIRFMRNGQEFGWWDGVNFHTGNIFVDVDEIAQFGNYGFVPYEDGETDGLDLVRVGG